MASNADSLGPVCFTTINSPSTPNCYISPILYRPTRKVPGVLTVHAEGERSQYQNRIAAGEQLARVLRGAIAPPPAKRRPTRPSRRAKDRRIAGKKQRGETKRLRRSVED